MKNANVFLKAGVLLLACAMLFATSAVANTMTTESVAVTEPEAEPMAVVFDDDFESYTDWLLDFPPWTNVDVDGSGTYGITDTDWPESGYTGAFVIFNPSATTPALTSEAWLPYSGDKYAACFAATSYPNDDWLITPQIDLGNGPIYVAIHCVSYDAFVLMIDDVVVNSNGDGTGTFEFMGKSVTDQYGLERFQIGVSETGTDPEDFTIITVGQYVEAPIEWTAYSYDIGGGAPEDTTPPETSISLDGTQQGGVYIEDVDVTLTATDDMSGVADIFYKVDGAASWTTYSGIFSVSGQGSHSVEFYAIDNAGNEETAQTETFEIAYPPEINVGAITGGFGKASAEVSNDGAGDADDVAWDISFDGGLIILGATSGTIESLPAGESTTVDSAFVLGFGKTTIVVTADNASNSVNATVLLVFVKI